MHTAQVPDELQYTAVLFITWLLGGGGGGKTPTKTPKHKWCDPLLTWLKINKILLLNNLVTHLCQVPKYFWKEVRSILPLTFCKCRFTLHNQTWIRAVTQQEILKVVPTTSIRYVAKVARLSGNTRWVFLTIGHPQTCVLQHPCRYNVRGDETGDLGAELVLGVKPPVLRWHFQPPTLLWKINQLRD